ncbi:extracellular solute-binding protein [Paenibacillus rhizovicinus]|uniref:Extracellular solute-binding protein n=1 Tax=Paenibacillus rhizovicinus TaxID=2704463 RepID=A0A6C0NX77_9BACL|nr:extracellular solute-binding protein [Paenibacillus rhizovicinus]QHW30799.1 extracellular solute-binding protein [Paenibacillus rhizovicinus]
MHRKRMTAITAAGVLALSVALTACGSNNGENENAPAANADKNKAQNTTGNSGSANTPAAVADGPLVKYDPPIEVSTVRKFNSGLKFLPGESWDNNIYTNELKSDLGIQMKNDWIVDDQQYPKKLNVSMVAGDLPDIFEVNLQQLQLLIEADQIADLTDVFDKYATDLSKKAIENGDGIARKAASVNGRLMAIPNGGGGRDDAQFIYVRADWLKKLNLQPPKTMDDVINIAKAFANDDPDGNGKKDTFGLSLDYNLFNGWSGLDGFFNGYHAYPFNPGGPNSTGLNLVFMDKGGQLDYADIQPEVKTALGKLQDLFKAGAINPEFGVDSGEKSAALATAGKVGMTYGAFWVPTWPINEMIAKDPKVDWEIYPLVSADDQPVKALSNNIVPASFTVVSKKSKHPEAAVKILNFYMEKNYGESRDEKYHSQKNGDETIGVFGLSPVSGGFSETNQDDYYSVQEALTAKDPSKLNPTAKAYYDSVTSYRAGDVKGWPMEKLFGGDNTSTYGILGQYKKNNAFMTNAFLGAPTETMVRNGPALRDLEVKTFTKIIMGEQPLDSFDQFVADWKKQGGDQIIQEVNDWYKEHK